MGLFKKDYCDICGAKIGLFGNNKLSDANICDDCRKKLSPWFTGRKKSTLEQIKEQLAYREANQAEVEKFQVSRSFGLSTKVLLDDAAHKFIVTSASNWRNANPDVLDFEAVTGCEIDIDESKSEQKTKNDEGKLVSYDPPRYDYSYSFRLIIRVNHPYFDEMSFNAAESVNEEDHAIGNHVMNHFHGEAYKASQQKLEELRDVILGLRKTLEEEAEAAKPKASVVCPFCNATTTPDANGNCEYCGAHIEK